MLFKCKYFESGLCLRANFDVLSNMGLIRVIDKDFNCKYKSRFGSVCFILHFLLLSRHSLPLPADSNRIQRTWSWFRFGLQSFKFLSISDSVPSISFPTLSRSHLRRRHQQSEKERSCQIMFGADLVCNRSRRCLQGSWSWLMCQFSI